MSSSLTLTSWNVNSIKAREQHVLDYMKNSGTDILMVQELKSVDLPPSFYELPDWNIVVNGQKTYNGVAIFSRSPFETILNKLPGNDADEQARYLEVDVNGLRVINIYLPNGNPVDTEKYSYKLDWMDRLYDRLSHLRNKKIPFVIGGDFNVIPESEDCHDPIAWKDDALFRLETRQKFRALENLGLYDAFRIFDKTPNQYTFWDYQAGAWPANKGIRIDHFLLCPLSADKAISCRIDAEPRGKDKPSDHTPIQLEIEKAD